MSNFLGIAADILIIIAAGKFIWKHIPSSDDLYSIRKSFIDFRDEAKRLKEEVVNLRRVELTNIAENLKTRDATAKKSVHVDEKLDSFQQSFQESTERMNKFMESGLYVHHVVIKSNSMTDKRLDEFEKFLRDLLRRLHIRTR